MFLSHDDHDHVGNLETVLEMCPHATLVCNFGIMARLFGDVDLPVEPMGWVDDGESLDVGDRTLTAIRPPMFDSPATRGLYDDSTRLLWAVDSFGTLFPGAVWLEWVVTERFAAHVCRTAALPLDVVASAHGPFIAAPRSKTRCAARSTLPEGRFPRRRGRTPSTS